MNFFLLPAAVFIGIATSYEDWKTGKIRNVWTLTAIIYSIAFFSVSSAFLWYNGILNASYLYAFSVNAIVSLAFSFAFWLGGFWSEGDAKLFLAYALLLPTALYSWFYIPVFPSSVLILTSFIPLFVFLVSKNIERFHLRLSELSDYLRPWRILSSFMIFAGISLISETLASSAGISMNFFTVFILLFTVFMLLNQFDKIYTIIFSGSLIMLKILYSPADMLTFAFHARFVLFYFMIMILGSFITSSSFEIFTEKQRPKNLREGMIPAEFFVRAEQEIKTKKIDFRSPIIRFPENVVFFSRKLTAGQIAILRKNDVFGRGSLKVHQTIPFAPLLLFGVLANIVMYIISLL